MNTATEFVSFYICFEYFFIPETKTETKTEEKTKKPKQKMFSQKIREKFPSKRMTHKKHSMAGIIHHHVDLDKPPKRKLFPFFHELFEGTTLHALPDIFNASKSVYRIVWGIVFLLATAACSYHLYVMLAEIVESPTVSRTTYEFAQEMAFPRLEICAQLGRMLDTEKLEPAVKNGEITIEYIYALELGLGIYNHEDSTINDGLLLNFTIVEEAYNFAVAKHGSIIEAWRDLYKNYRKVPK